MPTPIDEIVDTALDKDSGAVQDVMWTMTKQVILTLRDAGMVVEPKETGGIWRDAGESALPAPRLQLRWVNATDCTYELVLPIHAHDIRRAQAPSGNFAVPLGHTRINGGSDSRMFPDGKIQMPYRDGAHIKWDGKLLNLPMFAVHWDGATMEITQDTKF